MKKKLKTVFLCFLKWDVLKVRFLCGVFENEMSNTISYQFSYVKKNMKKKKI